MNIKISHRKFIYIAIELVLWLISLVFLFELGNTYTEERFRTISLYSAIMSSVLISLNIKYEKGFLQPFNLILCCFVLFQTGLPVLYGIDTGYTEWNIEFFSKENLVTSLVYSIHCVHAFSLGGILGDSSVRNTHNLGINCLKDDNAVEKVAWLLIILTGIVAVPLTIYIFILSAKFGYSYIKVDTMGINNAITNFSRTVYPAACFLALIYSNKKLYKNIALFLLVFYAAISMAAGGRTVGISVLISVVYYHFTVVKRGKSNSIKTIIPVAVFFIGIMTLSVFIKNERMGSANAFSLLYVIENIVQEMGFNFTSICFTKLFVPGETHFQYGLSYLNSIIALIPASIDPTGLINYLKSIGPERWLGNSLHSRFGTIFDYGVGYSIIAESFYNFGYFGFVSVLIQGILLNKILKIEFKNNDKFADYIKVVMIWALTTYPRRSFSTLLKSIEYDIVLIIALVFIFFRFFRKRK